MATIQAALKRGIEQTFQIESSELVVEALPSACDRKSLLLYESAEGGAGVLSQLASPGDQLATVAKAALTTMHYEMPDGPFTTVDLIDTAGHGTTGAPCEAGCYQCLLSYFNQRDHELIDRRDPGAVDFLVLLANALVGSPIQASPSPHSPPPGQGNSPLDLWLAELAHPEIFGKPKN